MQPSANKPQCTHYPDERALKRLKTSQTDNIHNTSSAQPETATDASDEHQAQFHGMPDRPPPLDIPPLAAETGPQTIPPDFANAPLRARLSDDAMATARGLDGGRQ